MTDKELAVELTKSWIEANSKLKNANGSSSIPGFSVGDIQKAYLNFLSVINSEKAAK